MRKKLSPFCFLSLIGFILLHSELNKKVYCKNNADIDLYFKLLSKSISLAIIYTFLPTALILCLTELTEKLPHFHTVLNILGLIYIYISGVIITAKLIKWKEKHIA